MNNLLVFYKFCVRQICRTKPQRIHYHLVFFVDVQKVCHIYYVDMCTVCLRGGRYKPVSNGLLVTAVLPGGKGDFSHGHYLVTLQTANILPLESCISAEVHYHKLFQLS